MNKEVNEFLDKGLLKYKEAHEVYWQFRSEIGSLLNEILENKTNDGSFKINSNSSHISSWDNGLHIVCWASAFYQEQKFFIGIGIDWTYGATKRPLPFAWIEDNNDKIIRLDNSKEWIHKPYNKSQRLGYFDNFSMDNIESIFNSLLDELIEYINEL